MADHDRTEPRTMAKAQKTLMIPEDLYRIFAAQEKQSGVSFSRQAIAAFCCYFFNNLGGPDPAWLQAVVAVENGELTIPEFPVHVARTRAKCAREIAARARQIIGNETYSAFDPDAMDREASRLEEESYRWERRAARGSDPIESFISDARHHQRQLHSHFAPMSFDVQEGTTDE